MFFQGLAKLVTFHLQLKMGRKIQLIAGRLFYHSRALVPVKSHITAVGIQGCSHPHCLKLLNAKSQYAVE